MITIINSPHAVESKIGITGFVVHDRIPVLLEFLKMWLFASFVLRTCLRNMRNDLFFFNGWGSSDFFGGCAYPTDMELSSLLVLPKDEFGSR